MKDETNIPLNSEEGPGKKETYVIGFILSLILTLVAYFLAAGNIMSGWALVFTVGSLAFVQVVIQLVFFLHIGEEPAPRLNFIVFLFMVLIVLIIVVGSIWIMYHLDYQMIPDSTGKMK